MNKTFFVILQISINGSFSFGVDDISFTKDTCEPIPYDDTSKGTNQKCI